MNPDAFVRELVEKLRGRAAFMRRHGAAEAATTCDRIAEELDHDFRAWWLAELTVGEASIESGYSTERLRELVREGRLPDRRPPGRDGEIRIRRADLPRRPSARAPTEAVEALAAQVLAGRK